MELPTTNTNRCFSGVKQFTPLKCLIGRTNMKVNITIDDELMSKVDEYCDAYYQSRSGFFAQCAVEKLQAIESLNTLAEITSVLDKVASNETGIDEDTQKEIDELTKLSTKLLKYAKK